MYKRTGKLIDKKFKEFFIPTILMTASLSLSLVVDSVMVSNILGPSELAAVNLVLPISMCVSTICGLFGVGGSTLIAILMGERNVQKANKVFTASILGILLLGGIGFSIGIFAIDELTGLLVSDPVLSGLTSAYLRVFLMGTPLMLFAMGFVYFVRTDGMPKLASGVLIIANVVNLILNFVYMQIFEMGIGGAALATITGYTAGCVMLVSYMKSPLRVLKFVKLNSGDISLYPEIAGLGISSALGQALMFLKILCINSLLLSIAGENGIVAFSVCVSCLSLASVFISGAAQSMIPMLGNFYGERDIQGVRYTMKKALTIVLLSCAALTVFLEAFPALVLSLFGITQPEAVETGVQAIRIFSLSLIGTGFSFMMMYYMQTIKRKGYSVAICFCQGFAAIVPLSYILGGMFGIVGIWGAFVAAEVITAVFIFLTSAIIVRMSNNALSGLFMIEKPDISIPVLDVTIENTEEAAVGLSEQVIRFCAKNKVAKSKLLGILIEDMVMNIILYNKDNRQKGYIDIILRVYDKEAFISFRDDGAPFDPTKYTEEEKDIYSINNIEMVRRIATRIEYSRAIGLNCTLLVLAIE